MDKYHNDMYNVIMLEQELGNLELVNKNDRGREDM